MKNAYRILSSSRDTMGYEVIALRYLKPGGLIGYTLKLDPGGNIMKNSFLSADLSGCRLQPAGIGVPGTGPDFNFSSVGSRKMYWKEPGLSSSAQQEHHGSLLGRSHTEHAWPIILMAFLLPSSSPSVKKGERSTVGIPEFIVKEICFCATP